MLFQKIKKNDNKPGAFPGLETSRFRRRGNVFSHHFSAEEERRPRFVSLSEDEKQTRLADPRDLPDRVDSYPFSDATSKSPPFPYSPFNRGIPVHKQLTISPQYYYKQMLGAQNKFL